METIYLLPVMHNGEEKILLKYTNLQRLNLETRKIKGIKWSQTHKAWYLPLSEETYKKICASLQQHCVLDIKALQQYLEKKKLLLSTSPPISNDIPKAPPVIKNTPIHKKVHQVTPNKTNTLTRSAISIANSESLKKITKRLNLYKETHITRLHNIRNVSIAHRDQNTVEQLSTIFSISWVEAINFVSEFDQILNLTGHFLQDVMNKSVVEFEELNLKYICW